MKYKKIIILLNIFLCFLAILGCRKVENSKEIIENIEIDENAPGWKKHASEDITFDWYINYSWYTTTWGENLISKEITKQTGVNINFVVPTGNETEKLNSMIASDTLPDLITLGWWESQVQELTENDLVYALNELADQYDPYFYQVVDNDVVNWFTNSDGNIYCYPSSSVSPKDYEEKRHLGSNQNFLVRKDIYEAIGSPDMTTPSGFISAIEKAVDMFPTVNGKKLIPIGADEFNTNGSNSFDKYLQNFLAIPYEVNGEYHDRYTDPEYIRWLKTFRKLNEMGYLSEEIFIDKRTQLEEKMEQGIYFCMLYQGSDIQTSQKALYSKDPNMIYIAVDGPKNSRGDDPVLPSTGISGWTVTFISKNCKNPERAIEFLSYLISEEGQKMVYLGVPGTTYDVIDGKAVIRPNVLQLLNTDRKKYDEVYGADNAYWMLADNVLQGQWEIKEQEPMAQLKAWTHPYTEYTAQYDILFEENSDMGIADAAIKSEWGKYLPQLLLAHSEEEFDKLLAEYVDIRDRLGYEDILDVSTEKMNEAKERLGIN